GQVRTEIDAEMQTFFAAQRSHAVQVVNAVAARFLDRGTGSPADFWTPQVTTGLDAILARIIRRLSIKADEVALDEMKSRKIYAAGLAKRWDVFISHASEDKQDFVDGFKKALEASGVSVWYDQTALTIGDSLRGKIDEGLANSGFGIVVLSPYFL